MDTKMYQGYELWAGHINSTIWFPVGREGRMMEIR